MARNLTIPVPRQWSKYIKSSFIQTISLASAAFTSTCALAAKRKATHTQLKAELARALHEITLLEEELSIKHARLKKVPPHKRPYYTPILRMQILKLRAARRWSIAQTAEHFLINEQTVIS